MASRCFNIGASGATFKIFVNPLVNWLWLGSFLFLAGVIIAAWPEKEIERVAVPAVALAVRGTKLNPIPRPSRTSGPATSRV